MAFPRHNSLRKPEIGSPFLASFVRAIDVNSNSLSEARKQSASHFPHGTDESMVVPFLPDVAATNGWTSGFS